MEACVKFKFSNGEEGCNTSNNSCWGGGLRCASLCPAMWLLTGVARWKLYLFIVAGCNNPGDTWEIFTAIKISKKNFMGVICVRPMDAVHSFRISRPVYTSRFQRWGGKKGSRVRVAASCVVEEMMHLHCYSGASLKTLTSDRFIDEI